jgi:hypothetical protein
MMVIPKTSKKINVASFGLLWGLGFATLSVWLMMVVPKASKKNYALFAMTFISKV